jgi:signal transduction histidine kinase
MSFSASVQKVYQRLKAVFKKGGREEKSELTFLKQRVEFLEKLLEEKNTSIDKAKSTFLKNLYHEIRTPLNAIIGFSDLIDLNNITGKEKEVYVSHIRESSRDFLRKMDNIIEASIIEAGLLTIQSEQCQLYELLTEIYAYFSLHKHIAERRIAFLLNVPKNLQKTEVICDIYRVTQVLSHLISNAFKYTPQGVVEFGCRIVGQDLHFFVKDTGVGGLEGKEDVLFKNFTKMENLEDTNEGLGLGLGLSKSIIEQMDGKIWFEANKSKGTTFWFTIPYKPAYVKGNSKSDHTKSSVIPLSRVYKRSVVL